MAVSGAIAGANDRRRRRGREMPTQMPSDLARMHRGKRGKMRRAMRASRRGARMRRA